MRKKQEPVTASQDEMNAAIEVLSKELEYNDTQMAALKEERKIAIDTCVAAGVPKPVVAEIIRRFNMDQETKNMIDVYVPLLENHLDNRA